MSRRLIKKWIREHLILEVAATASQIFKDPDRVANYLDQIKKGTPFELVAGGTVIIPAKENAALVSALESFDKIAFNQAWKIGVQTSSGIMQSSGAIKKTPALGGESAGKRLDKEDRQIAEIQTAIDAAGGMVDINLGRKVAKGVTSIDSVKGTPKADAVLVAGETIVGSISLKYARSPNQMQQWGGLTTLYESEEPTVVEFIKDVKYLEENSPNSRLDITYYREIKDTAIAKKICYGSGGWPENDADIIIASQAPIQIDKSGEFIADHLFYNPEIPGGDWYPTLFARFSTGRGGSVGLKNVRLSLSPKGSRVGKPLPNRPAESQIEEPSDVEIEIVEEVIEEALIRAVIRESLLSEELTKSDKDEIKRIARKQAKKYVDAELDKALGASFFGKKGKVNKFVDDEINKRFKDGDKDKDFSDSVEKVAKRVLQALYTMHFKRNNLIKTMPVPKS